MAGKKILIIDMEAASRSFVGAALQKEKLERILQLSGFDQVLAGMPMPLSLT